MKNTATKDFYVISENHTGSLNITNVSGRKRNGRGKSHYTFNRCIEVFGKDAVLKQTRKAIKKAIKKNKKYNFKTPEEKKQHNEKLRLELQKKRNPFTYI